MSFGLISADDARYSPQIKGTVKMMQAVAGLPAQEGGIYIYMKNNPFHFIPSLSLQ